MAAGKSTLARELAAREDAVLFVQDELLGALYPGEFVDLMAFVERNNRLTTALGPHIRSLLIRGVPVVLDFAANTRGMRVLVPPADRRDRRGARAALRRRVGRAVQASARRTQPSLSGRHEVDHRG